MRSRVLVVAEGTARKGGEGELSMKNDVFKTILSAGTREPLQLRECHKGAYRKLYTVTMQIITASNDPPRDLILSGRRAEIVGISQNVTSKESAFEYETTRDANSITNKEHARTVLSAERTFGKDAISVVAEDSFPTKKKVALAIPILRVYAIALAMRCFATNNWPKRSPFNVRWHERLKKRMTEDRKQAGTKDVKQELADAWHGYATKCPTHPDKTPVTAASRYKGVACACKQNGKADWCMLSLKPFYNLHSRAASQMCLMQRIGVPEFDAEKLAAKIGWAVNADASSLKFENGDGQIQRGNYKRCKRARLPVVVGWRCGTESMDVGPSSSQVGQPDSGCDDDDDDV